MTASASATPRRFCRDCGTELVDGRCPHHETGPAQTASRRRWLIGGAVVAAIAVFLIGSAAVAVWFATSLNSLEQEVDRVAATVVAMEANLEALDQRLSGAEGSARAVEDRAAALEAWLAEVEAERESQPELTALAAELQDSVVTVVTPWGEGSGFPIETRSGNVVILTNYHVIEHVWVRGGREVEIRTSTGTVSGQVTGVSLSNDLAVIDPTGLHVPLPVRTAELSVGEAVVAVGSPRGFEGTVSTGIISALRDEGVQFTAPVTFGNSGGPLVDEHGRVIGVVTRGHADARAAISFAVPMDVVCTTVTSCREGG